MAYLCSQDLRSVYHQPTKALGRAIAEKVVGSFPTCPIPEIRRLGSTLKQWRTAFLAYFTTNGASNGGTEAINGLIELGPPHRPRLSQPRELPPQNATDRRRATPMTPHSGPKSRLWTSIQYFMRWSSRQSRIEEGDTTRP